MPPSMPMSVLGVEVVETMMTEHRREVEAYDVGMLASVRVFPTGATISESHLSR
jgi:hypothetical protein